MEGRDEREIVCEEVAPLQPNCSSLHLLSRCRVRPLGLAFTSAQKDGRESFSMRAFSPTLAGSHFRRLGYRGKLFAVEY